MVGFAGRRLRRGKGIDAREVMAGSDRVSVTGSERELVPGHTRVGDVDPHAEVDLTVYVRPRASLDWVDAESGRPPAERRLVSHEDWAELYGASDEDMRAVAAFALDAGLTVVELDSGDVPSTSGVRCATPRTPSRPRCRAATRAPRAHASIRRGPARSRSRPPSAASSWACSASTIARRRGPTSASWPTPRRPRRSRRFRSPRPTPSRRAPPARARPSGSSSSAAASAPLI